MAYKLVTTNLVAHWDASDWTSGTSWTDSVNGKVITFSSAPSSKSSDGIELTSSITFTSLSINLSVTACTFEWLGRIDGNWSSSAPGNVFNLGAANGTWNSSNINAYSKTSNGVQLDLNSSGTVKSSIYTSGIEYHIIVTVTSAGKTTLYVNSTTSKGSSTVSAIGSAAKNYVSNNEGSGRFYGAISRMCLWNTVLTSSLIATLFEEEEVPSYQVTTTIENGTLVSPTLNPTSVYEGDSLLLSFKGNDGYVFKSMTVDGTSVTPTVVKTSTATLEYTTNYGTYSTYAFSLAYDGSTSTYFWSNEALSVGKYILIAFSVPVTLKTFTTYSSNSTDMPKDNNELQVSTDGETWETVGTFTNNATTSFTNIGKLNVNYVRIYCTSTITNWLVINEITIEYEATELTSYQYTLSNVTGDTEVSIVFRKTNVIYIKLNDAWVEVRGVYMKILGEWVLLDTVNNLFDTTTKYLKMN